MKQKGFTLIELLVVIAIIGLLAGAILIYLGSARAKSRDARRLDDMHQIQTAMELFYSTCNGYPDTLEATATIAGCPNGETLSEFLPQIPVNPTPNGADYVYTPDPSNDRYSVSFVIETNTGGLDSGSHTMSPAGIQ